MCYEESAHPAGSLGFVPETGNPENYDYLDFYRVMSKITSLINHHRETVKQKIKDMKDGDSDDRIQPFRSGRLLHHPV